MWRKNNNKTPSPKTEHNRVKSSQQMDTLIGGNTRITGDISFSGGLHVNGVVSGNVTSLQDESSLLVVGKSAKITGDVKVNRAVVNGTIVGKVYVYEHLELGECAIIKGDVHYCLLEMSVGSEVHGNMTPGIQQKPQSLLEDHNTRSDFAFNTSSEPNLTEQEELAD